MILSDLSNYYFGLPHQFLTFNYYNIPSISESIPVGLPPVLLTLILLVFAFYPAIYPTAKFFKKRGFENVIVEYQYLKKILYISVFTMITILVIYYLLDSYRFSISVDEYVKVYDRFWAIIDSIDTSYALVFMILPVSVSIIIKLLFEHARKDFRLYYAKGCFKIVSNEDIRVLDKAKYFKTGLIWYNKFLKKNIGLHINDIMKIYSKIITDSPLYQNSALISISESFNNEDELNPLRCISDFIPDKEHTLTQGSITTTIKESSDLLIPIIGVIITIITTFILPKPPTY